MSNNERFFLTSPHSGEQVPDEVEWLKNLDEVTLMFDVDRFVDQLYETVALELNIPLVKSHWHRYFSDANRLPEDIDQGSVVGATQVKGTHLTGLIWQQTSQGHQLLSKPISQDLYRSLLTNYYQEFHTEVLKTYQDFFKISDEPVYQLDLHSMPSVGTEIHKDPGQTRAEVVISDQNGKSADKAYFDLVVESYSAAGFQVKTNWPYIGGRVTQTYGQPSKNQHCIQVELRRDLYMTEATKQKDDKKFEAIQARLSSAIESIFKNISQI